MASGYMEALTESSEENVDLPTPGRGRGVFLKAGVGLAVTLGLLAAVVVSTGGSAALRGSETSKMDAINENDQAQNTSVAEPVSGIYNIKNAYNTLYLNVAGNTQLSRDHRNGDNVQLWDNPSQEQSRWLLLHTQTPGVYNIQLAKDRTYSMNLAQGSDANVQLESSPERAASQWLLLKIGTSDNYLIKARDSYQYVSADGDTRGSNVRASSDVAGARDQWLLEEVLVGDAVIPRGETPLGTSLGYRSACNYSIMTPERSLVVSLANGGGSKETHVQLHNSTLSLTSQWELSPRGNGIYTIKNLGADPHVDGFLNVAGGGRWDIDYMQIYDNPLSPDSMFSLYLDADNFYLIRNIQTKKYLTASGEGLDVRFTGDISRNTTRWVLESVGDDCDLEHTHSAGVACSDGLPLTPIHQSECPVDLNYPNCDTVLLMDLCEGDGECGTDNELNNCNGHNIYRKQLAATTTADPPSTNTTTTTTTTTMIPTPSPTPLNDND